MWLELLIHVCTAPMAAVPQLSACAASTQSPLERGREENLQKNVCIYIFLRQ